MSEKLIGALCPGCNQFIPGATIEMFNVDLVRAANGDIWHASCWVDRGGKWSNAQQRRD